ncbi:MAG: signal peptidase I [Planctomycetaceae bacterium]|nr:signal peptidase I [Planctomycetaceae bacterium]
MSKHKPIVPRLGPRESLPKAESEGESHGQFFSAAGIRETIESLAIAFVLAFLFRTFEAEAFVIPTGSMAPTLMGRHKDLNCPMCGYRYQLGSSEEVDADGAPIVQRDSLGRPVVAEVRSGTCPMCRYTADLRDTNDFRSYPRSYNGDRILVDKLAYDFTEPKRWDVVVFHYPNDATTNYIKRMVGLPGETVRIQNGDIWTRRDEGKPFEIERKRPDKLLAMLQPVFDNDYMPEIAKHGWPARWEADRAHGPNTWQTEGYTTFSIDGRTSGEQWLRYHHMLPTVAEWEAVKLGQSPTKPSPQLIKDFVAFDTSRGGGHQPAPTVGTHWVGDLALECAAEVQSDTGVLALELRKGGRHFQCHIDVATGRATLSISGADAADFRPTALTAVRGKGRHELRLSNCDNELLLWVDGSAVQFDKATRYAALGNTTPKDDDLEPVGIGSSGAAVLISHVRIRRDIYYIAVKWPASDVPMRDVREGYVDFELAKDKFLMLGDNSANSQDSRLWAADPSHPHAKGLWPPPNELYWVDRDLLIGKAMFIYWPHSWYYAPVVDLPLWPNFARMRLVR